MSISTGKRTPPRNQRRRLHSAAGFLAIALAAGALFLVFEFQEDARVRDDPALDALLRAQSHLAQSYGPEQDLLSQSQAAHRELSAAIDLLAAAEREDPAKTREIEQLRTSLNALATERNFEEMTSEKLQVKYRDLRAELKALIDGHLERRH